MNTNVQPRAMSYYGCWCNLIVKNLKQLLMEPKPIVELHAF